MTERAETEEVYVRRAQGQVESIAGALERLAGNLRKRVGQFAAPSPTGGAVYVAVDVVNTFTETVGRIGVALPGVMLEAWELDQFRAVLRGEGDPK
jgi:hypothetical protein